MQAPSEEVVPVRAAGRLQARYGTPGRAANRAWQAISSRLPLPLAYRAARVQGRARYLLRRRRIALRPELEQLAADRAQLDDWKRRQCEQSACAGLDYAILRRRGRGRAERLVRIEGLAHLDAALADGSGALLYSFHLCGIVTVLAGLAQLGYPLNVIRRAALGLTAPAEIARARRREEVLEHTLGCRLLLMEPGNFGVAVKAANALRRNEVVVALVDVAFSGPAAEVDLLGARTVLPAGHCRIAEACGAPLLDLFCHRDSRTYSLSARIGAPLVPAADLAATLRRSVARLEPDLARHPHTWLAPADPALVRPAGDPRDRTPRERVTRRR